MKAILILCGAVAVAIAVTLWWKLRLPDQFGIFTGAPHAEVNDLIERPQDFLHKTVTIEGIVRKQCTTMGCYFFFSSTKSAMAAMPAMNDRWLRVDLADVAMHAPRRNGHPARVEGQVVPYVDGYQFWASAVEFK